MRRSWVPGVVVGAVVLVAAVVAVVVSRGGDDPTAPPTAFETGAVRAEGTALPALEGDGVSEPGSDPAIGRPAPVLHGQGFDGAAITIGGSGRPMVIAFVAHWCPHCRKEVPLLQQWRDDGQLPAGVDWYTVSTAVHSDGPNYPPSAWLAREGWSAPVLADSMDSYAAQYFGLPGFPYFVAVKADGTVAARASGELGVDDVRRLLGAASG